MPNPKTAAHHDSDPYGEEEFDDPLLDEFDNEDDD